MRALIAIALVGCGDDLVPRDAAGDAAVTCSAQLTGNIVDMSASIVDCPTVATDPTGATTLQFTVHAMRLEVPLAIAIDLGALAPGDYSSETVQDWSASAYATDVVGSSGVCQLRAGHDAVPQGSFALTLTSADASGVHGSLALELYVLAFPDSYCGLGDLETVQLVF
jgi:hypothetical protein